VPFQSEGTAKGNDCACQWMRAKAVLIVIHTSDVWTYVAWYCTIEVLGRNVAIEEFEQDDLVGLHVVYRIGHFDRRARVLKVVHLKPIPSIPRRDGITIPHAERLTKRTSPDGMPLVNSIMGKQSREIHAHCTVRAPMPTGQGCEGSMNELYRHACVVPPLNSTIDSEYRERRRFSAV
jgi:hypothetical protein